MSYIRMGEMTEKQYCGLCTHLSRKDIKNGLPQLYCGIIGKEVSFIGFACPKFEERVVFDEEDYELNEIVKGIFK